MFSLCFIQLAFVENCTSLLINGTFCKVNARISKGNVKSFLSYLV